MGSVGDNEDVSTDGSHPVLLKLLDGIPQVLRQLQQPFLIYQLDGTAYPGNSGSPVYSVVDGTVVAVINMVYVKQTKESVLSNPSGISYAIPSRHLRALLARPFEG